MWLFPCISTPGRRGSESWSKRRPDAAVLCVTISTRWSFQEGAMAQREWRNKTLERAAWAGVVWWLAWSAAAGGETDPRADALNADVWRREQRLIDVHMHVEGDPQRYERAVRVMNAAGIGVALELGSGTTLAPVGPSNPCSSGQTAR